MMKSAYDVNKYNIGQGSNSDVANDIGKLISDLEEHEQKIKEKLEELKSIVSGCHLSIYIHICPFYLPHDKFLSYSLCCSFHSFVICTLLFN